MMRSGQVRISCVSAASVSCSLCVQIETALAATDMRLMGHTLARLRHCHRPSIHHAHRQSTAGRITVDDLLAMASAAKSNVNP